MPTTNLTIRMDSDLKARAEQLFESMGMSFTTALTVFTKTVVREGHIPFLIEGDPFYSAENQAHLDRVIADAEAGRGITVMTVAELEEMVKNSER